MKRIDLYSVLQVFLMVHAAGMGMLYLIDVLVKSDVYEQQQYIENHFFFGSFFIVMAIASLLIPKYAHQVLYRILMVAAFAVYIGLAYTFVPFGPTAVWTYLLIAGLFLYEARR